MFGLLNLIKCEFKYFPLEEKKIVFTLLKQKNALFHIHHNFNELFFFFLVNELCLISDLGPSSEAWFDNLTSEHDQHQKVMVHADRQPGWSPCPSGGVLHVAGEFSSCSF